MATIPAGDGAARAPFMSTPDLLLTAGVALVTLWALITVRRRLRARLDEQSTPRERIDAIRDRAAKQSKGADELGAVMADAEELTRRLAAHLDNKAARLQLLLDEADARIAELNRLAGNASRADARSQVRTTAAARRAAVPLGPPDDVDPLSRDVYRLADEGADPLAIAQRLNEQVGKVKLILALREA